MSLPQVWTGESCYPSTVPLDCESAPTHPAKMQIDHTCQQNKNGQNIFDQKLSVKVQMTFYCDNLQSLYA